MRANIFNKQNFYSSVFVLIASLIIIEDVLSVGVDKMSIVRYTVFGVPARDYALLISLFIFVLNFKSIVRPRSVKPSYIYWLILLGCYGFFRGLLVMGRYSNDMNGDIRTILWIFGGFGLGFVFVATDRTLLFSRAIIVVSSLLTWIATILTPEFVLYSEGALSERVTAPGAFIFSGIASYFIIYSSNISTNLFKSKLLPLFGLFVFVYCTVILGNTRSQLLAAIVISWMLFRSFRFVVNGDQLHQRRISVAKVYSVVLLILAFGLVFIPLMDESRIERLSSVLNPSATLSDSRFLELTDFFENSTIDQLLFGRGFGGGVSSAVYDGDIATTLHIGILNFWLKFGIFPFLIISYIVFLRVPIIYFRSWRALTRQGVVSSRDMAAIIIIPCVFPWLAFLLISGGFGEIPFALVGLSIYCFAHIMGNSSASL